MESAELKGTISAFGNKADQSMPESDGSLFDNQNGPLLSHSTRPLLGKVALVTGASRGIGSAIARSLAAHGAKVAVNYRFSKIEAEKLTQHLIEDYGVEALPFQADVSVTEAVEKLFGQIEDTLGPVEILVNNAGIGLRRLVMETSDHDWERIIGTNLSGTFYCCRRALPQMIRRRWGRIINITSVFGLTGASFESAYSAAKGGQIALTKSLAREVGSAGITVNAIAPGPVETDMLREELDAEQLRILARHVPCGRLGKPEDIASACAFLASPAAAFINGQVLGVDGGWLP